MIYFDNAATTFPKPIPVVEGITKAMNDYSFNAGRGSYKQAKDTFQMIEQTRQKLADIVNCKANSVVFTSSATESLNNIIYGLNLKDGDIVFVSPFEHNAVIRTLHNLNVIIKIMPFNKKTWEVEIDKLNDMFVIDKPKAVIISHVSNVTGYELPYQNIFTIAKKYNSLTILDCAQSYAIYPIEKENVDFIVFAGHKSLYAMFGIAGYINVTNYKLSTYKVGGTGSDSLNTEMPSELPYRYEAGSLNSVGIYSIFCSIDFLKNANFKEKKLELTEYLIKQLEDLDNIKIYLPENYISKGIVSFSIEGYTSDDIGKILSDDYDICVRTGYHCAPYVHDFIESKDSFGTVRVSLSGFNTKEEIDELVSSLEELI